VVVAYLKIIYRYLAEETEENRVSHGSQSSPKRRLVPYLCTTLTYVLGIFF